MRETIVLEIKGMHCPDCPAKVERSLAKIDGVDHVAVDYGSENGCVTYDSSLTSMNAITRRISLLGFEARSIQENVK